MKMYERNPGQGRTALLLHPMLSSAEGIELCVTNFWGEGVHCFVPDLSGHGEDAAATYHSAAEEAKAIHDVLVEQGCTHLDLGFGASLGGVVLFEMLKFPDLDLRGCLQKNGRPAAKGFGEQYVERPAAVFKNVGFQLVRLLLRGGIGGLAGAVKAVEADGVNAVCFFQQRDHILKLPPAHQVAVQQHDGFPGRVAESFDLHGAFSLLIFVP